MLAGSHSRSSIAAALAAPMLVGALSLAASGGAFADEHDRDRHDRDGGAVKLLWTIPVPTEHTVNSPNCPTSGTAHFAGMCTFDISWIDQHTQRYYLADRSNSAVDVVDAKHGTFVKQIKGGFKGFTGNNDTSGPNGVVTAGRWLIVTDAPSRVVAIDLTTDAIASEVPTGGAPGLRTDEIAYDPVDSLILAANNADDPPFASLISLDTSNGHLTIVKKIVFDAAHGVDATNGAEQPVWDSGTGRFYISIPQVGPNAKDGGVARINTSGVVETVYPVTFCQPAGLTVGPRGDLLIGCSVAFDDSGASCSTAAGTDVTTCSAGHFAMPKQVIMDAGSGAIDQDVFGVGGSDEVWFNSGDNRYYTASRANPEGPVLGVIDARRDKLLQVVPTAPLPYGSPHSVAANRHNNHVFAPLPANNVVPNCLTGCIGVYGVPDDD
jgi:hypothetical protein